MNIDIHHHCTDFESYRSARVKSLFNVESGADVHIHADLPIENHDWKIGVIVGASGTGKTSIAQSVWSDVKIYNPIWTKHKPIIDDITPDQPFDHVTAALSSVGLGTVPAWLRPHHVLSNGEQFRANLARAVCEAPDRLIIDEFTSVVDRQIACIGAGAFAKTWRRNHGQVILATCHYDVLDWVEPDWIFDTNTGKFHGRLERRRPRFNLEIHQTNWRYWHLFEPHHYLKMPLMIAATNYVATVNGELVAHLAVSTRPGLIEARACRLVVMPEWQGAGVGLKFLNAVCEMWLQGQNRYDKALRTIFHTSHPALAAALRRDPKWTQISGKLIGDKASKGLKTKSKYGGHFRAVQGFRYLGADYD
ncbi:GNAT family N-acetyltransferase [Acinetobacter defluvii]|uniref:GNAT family N-acetyltransferase n=1 Tax=Acinetobacter defluvii TaxID=1871111 RepID=UPI003AF5D2A7